MLRALEAGSSTGWVAAVEIGGFVGAGLHDENVAEPPPTQDRIRQATAVRHKLAPAAEGQLIHRCRQPAVLARAPHRTVLGLAIVKVHGAATSILTGERALRSGSLVVRQ